MRTTAHDGLDLIAQQRPLELKDAAMEFEGNRQRILLSAALKGWAKLDPKSSLSWVQENLTDDKQVQSERFFSVAEGWAEERPAEFLSELDMICQNPPADWTSEVLYARLGSLALVGVAEKDLEGAFSWWGRNREQIEVKQLHYHMKKFVMEQLTKNPEHLIQTMEKNGLLSEGENLFKVGGNNFDISVKWREIAKTVSEVSDSRGRTELIKEVAWELHKKSLQDAVEFVELAEGAGSESLAKTTVVNGLLGREVTLAKMNRVVDEFPIWVDDLREAAFHKAINRGRDENERVDYQGWIPVFEELLEREIFKDFNAFQPVMLRLGEPFLAQDPEAARAWMYEVMNGRMDDSIRDNFMGQAVGSWIKKDPALAVSWIKEQGFDSFSTDEIHGFGWGVFGLEENDPFIWDYFSALEQGAERIRMVEMLLENHSEREIREGLQGAELTEFESQVIEEIFNGKRSFR